MSLPNTFPEILLYKSLAVNYSDTRHASMKSLWRQACTLFFF